MLWLAKRPMSPTKSLVLPTKLRDGLNAVNPRIRMAQINLWCQVPWVHLSEPVKVWTLRTKKAILWSNQQLWKLPSHHWMTRKSWRKNVLKLRKLWTMRKQRRARLLSLLWIKPLTLPRITRTKNNTHLDLLLKKYDLNNDEILDKQELKEFCHEFLGQHKPPGAPDMDDVQFEIAFKNFDTNGNGTIEKRARWPNSCVCTTIVVTEWLIKFLVAVLFLAKIKLHLDTLFFYHRAYALCLNLLRIISTKLFIVLPK